MKKINLDHAAAVPLDQAVIEAMLPFYKEHYGNPSSGHGLGEEPKKALRQARENVAILVGAEPNDLIFTSSASEANNLAIKGFIRSGRNKGNHIIASSIEHFSVLNQLKSLQKDGFEVTLLPVDRDGIVDPEQLNNAIKEQTILVTIQTANPEIGTVQPIEKLAAVARERNIPFHTDATAAVGWIPLSIAKTEINMLSLAGDQFYGPKGSAALYVRRGTRLMPLIEGGIQEKGLRAGTENVAAIAGMGEAARIAALSLEQRPSAIAAIKDELKESLFSNVPHLHLNGHPHNRLPHNLNVTVEFVEGEALLMRLEMAGIYVSSGSSCTSQALKSSHVLAAIGLPPEMAQGSLQLTLGKESSSEDIPYVTEHFSKVSSLLRNMSPLYHQFLKEGQQDASIQ